MLHSCALVWACGAAPALKHVSSRRALPETTQNIRTRQRARALLVDADLAVQHLTSLCTLWTSLHALIAPDSVARSGARLQNFRPQAPCARELSAIPPAALHNSYFQTKTPSRSLGSGRREEAHGLPQRSRSFRWKARRNVKRARPELAFLASRVGTGITKFLYIREIQLRVSVFCALLIEVLHSLALCEGYVALERLGQFGLPTGIVCCERTGSALSHCF